MSDDSQRPIIVRRSKKVEGGHHGGAWKIAYADFVTAMMAFFLLMWLLGSTTKAELQGIAQYFKTPLKVALEGGSGSGDSSSVIKGGGTDLTRHIGQVMEGKTPPAHRTLQLAEARAEIERADAARLKGLKASMEKAINANAFLKQFKNQILLDITPEGLRIQIVDSKKRPMFDLGSATLKSYTQKILDEFGPVLNQVPNKISLSGYTDATPYSGGVVGYSNWELSADRANACRRELDKGGMDPKKILRVEGLGSAVPYDPANPYDPMNRRISILVLNEKTARAIEAHSGRSGASPPVSAIRPPGAMAHGT
ncbi:MAG: flagellar motor protein MotB [Betaproteobacteria bacterium]|nr:flagellar motor protein MotB [Betaproteobacteria bacterium]